MAQKNSLTVAIPEKCLSCRVNWPVAVRNGSELALGAGTQCHTDCRAKNQCLTIIFQLFS